MFLFAEHVSESGSEQSKISYVQEREKVKRQVNEYWQCLCMLETPQLGQPRTRFSHWYPQEPPFNARLNRGWQREMSKELKFHIHCLGSFLRQMLSLFSYSFLNCKARTTTTSFLGGSDWENERSHTWTYLGQSPAHSKCFMRIS